MFPLHCFCLFHCFGLVSPIVYFSLFPYCFCRFHCSVLVSSIVYFSPFPLFWTRYPSFAFLVRFAHCRRRAIISDHNVDLSRAVWMGIYIRSSARQPAFLTTFLPFALLGFAVLPLTRLPSSWGRRVGAFASSVFRARVAVTFAPLAPFRPATIHTWREKSMSNSWTLPHCLASRSHRDLGHFRLQHSYWLAVLSSIWESCTTCAFLTAFLAFAILGFAFFSLALLPSSWRGRVGACASSCFSARIAVTISPLSPFCPATIHTWRGRICATLNQSNQLINQFYSPHIYIAYIFSCHVTT